VVAQSGLRPGKLPVVRSFAIQIRPSEWEELRAAGIVARARMKVDFSSTHWRSPALRRGVGGSDCQRRALLRLPASHGRGGRIIRFLTRRSHAFSWLLRSHQ
jgi:hypothetical protein